MENLFGYVWLWKVVKKENNIKKNGFHFIIKNKEENNIIKISQKFMHLYIMKENKLNKFDEIYKNNLLTLNLLFIF